jgi:hypothetical protein
MQFGNFLKIKSQTIKGQTINLPVLTLKIADVRQQKQQFRLQIACLHR